MTFHLLRPLSIETLEQHIAANLKRGLPEEVPDVCDVLSVLAYAFGEEDGDFLLAGFLDGLINIASNWSQPNEPRVAVSENLAQCLSATIVLLADLV